MVYFGLPLIEWFGYLASVLVALSLTMSSIVRLRWVNLAGATLFATYGFIIGSFPVALLNLFIALTNIFYLVKMYQERDDFKIIQLSGSDQYVACFLEAHEEEINELFPLFQKASLPQLEVFYLVKNAVPIGILAGHAVDEETFCIDLDFVRPAYRDFRMGNFTYDPEGFFHTRGIRRLQAPVCGSKHDQYLERMGFLKKENIYEKHVGGR
ncbi:inner membrane protein [Alkalispirochaeta americana]|uniref:Inner membrane protein n=1 Tax=Alkalispirochaeta americana TaxID=159291 RepID=A0A1N6SXP8_9SPIO|nr:YgjV family protein [Alkalispirochaeta americana]SIQ45851.1 inner membrane protein [Alkalispirochaeta americana]